MLDKSSAQDISLERIAKLEQEEMSLLESLKQTQVREISSIKSLKDAINDQEEAAKQRLERLQLARSEQKNKLGVNRNLSRYGITI